MAITKEDSLRAALSQVLEATDEPPPRNCSCHLAPPCSDCVEWGWLREAREGAMEALKQPLSATITDTSPRATAWMAAHLRLIADAMEAGAEVISGGLYAPPDGLSLSGDITLRPVPQHAQGEG